MNLIVDDGSKEKHERLIYLILNLNMQEWAVILIQLLKFVEYAIMQ